MRLQPEVVDDVHSRLTATRVAGVLKPRSVADVQEALALAERQGRRVCIAGGRHAMGAQAFATGGLLLDMRGLDHVRHLDRERGVVDVEAGIEWPALVAQLASLQADVAVPWVIGQKQTGADRLTLGGAVAANIHGRGLRMAPFVSDVVSLEIVTADGHLVTASRTENTRLFANACGGYGLFGIVVALRLQLVRRSFLRRRVLVVSAENAVPMLDAAAECGALYGDFQVAIDDASPDFLRRGVLSWYEPAGTDRPTATPRELDAAQWMSLLELAHRRKSDAFAAYAAHYLATDGQVYASDTHQLALYLDDYHEELDRCLGATVPGSETIGEMYVPRPLLPAFLREAASLLRGARTPVVYGTVRLVERDDTTALPWARERWACLVLNLHVDHDDVAPAAASRAFERLYDLALGHGGSFYLTYGRHARADQLRAAYPTLTEVLRERARLDPAGRLGSDFATALEALLANDHARSA